MFGKVLGIGLIAVMGLGFVVVPALAQVDVNASGEVVAIDAVAGNFQLDAGGGDVYTVIPPEDFDLGTLSIGASVEVQGELEAGVITATSVEIVPPPEDVEVSGEVQSINEAEGSFEILTEDATAYSVIAPVGFDFASLAVDDMVVVQGALEDSSITATSVEILPPLPEEVEVSGEVQSINEAEGSFEILTEDGIAYTVIAYEGFDFASLAVGDMVVVQGTLEDSTIAAASIEILPPDDDEEEPKEGFYCRTPDARHPALNGLADLYGEPYEELLSFFCDGRFGVGEIMLALQTAATLNNGMDAGDVLAMRAELGGWGQVWKSLGLKGGK